MNKVRFLRENTVVELRVYGSCKYTEDMEAFENAKVVTYNNVKCFEVVTEKDAEQIELELDENSLDDFNEYLVLHFEDGETSTFRNSYCDMFVF